MNFYDAQKIFIETARKEGFDITEFCTWLKQHWDDYVAMSIQTEEQLHDWLKVKVIAFKGYVKAKKSLRKEE